MLCITTSYLKKKVQNKRLLLRRKEKINLLPYTHQDSEKKLSVGALGGWHLHFGSVGSDCGSAPCCVTLASELNFGTRT